MSERNEYPYYPPYEDEVTFFDETTVRVRVSSLS
jgi:hypothetical protein